MEAYYFAATRRNVDTVVDWSGVVDRMNGSLVFHTQPLKISMSKRLSLQGLAQGR